VNGSGSAARLGEQTGTDTEFRERGLPRSALLEERPDRGRTGTTPAPDLHRPQVDGKFLGIGGERLIVRGVTYGTFRPSADGTLYPSPEEVWRDFAAIRAAGANTVRVYTVPPIWLLDAAWSHGLRVLVGLPWEQHVTFLDDRRRSRAIVEGVRTGARTCGGHPALLAFVVGNEIPAAIVRWYPRRRVERFLAGLCAAVKDEDDGALVTYANYPSTEYLELPFLDLVCFNVFLEEAEAFDAYLARLHTVAGDRPLLVSELGIDGREHGRTAQAVWLSAQVTAAFRGGVAGAVVFSWTDEWHRGGYPVTDWEFGMVDRRRRPKTALSSVRAAFVTSPAWRSRTPRVSVVVCTHNGAATLAACLDGVAGLDYPNFETIVVDDGSTDETPSIAERPGVRLIRTANDGLSAARNVGLAAATGEIVAYIDDDARPDELWLRYLVEALLTTEHAGLGGPNLAPPASTVATAVAHAPGGPSHVLLSDREAEHIPGCNMAFWREALLEIDGFDPRFRVAGDDVDVCWRLQRAGRTLGFSPAAMVWHERRKTVRAFFRQQRGYGRAEALLEQKWPERYNAGGHVTWRGRIYNGPTARARRSHVYHGTWGSAAFQPLHDRGGGRLRSFALAPEWWALLLLLSLAAVYELSVAAVVPRPPLMPFPVTSALLFALAAALAGGVVSVAWHQRQPLHVKALTCLLTALQPLVRLLGRYEQGLTPWRRRAMRARGLPVPRTVGLWSEQWQPLECRLERVEDELRRQSLVVSRGGPYDRWDLQAAAPFGAARLRATVEEHGGGRQLVRFRVWPRIARTWVATGVGLGGLIAISSVGDAGAASVGPLVALGAILLWRTVAEVGAVLAIADRALRVTVGHEDEAAAVAGRGAAVLEAGLGVEVGLAVAEPTARSAP
jgi:glycosyltransferase involved in cell wall biosynthesis